MIKNFTVLTLALLLFQIAKAQKNIQDTTARYVTINGQRVGVVTTMEPEFRNGGAVGFRNFLAQNVVIPDSARLKKVVGRVVANFVVEKDGSLSEIKILGSPDTSLANAVIEAIKMSPLWRPGMQNGQQVRAQFTVALAFDLSK
jgi:protein TonB